MIYDSATAAHKFLCAAALNSGLHAAGAYEAIDQHMMLTFPKSNMIPEMCITSYRKISVPYLLAELAWYWSGSNDTLAIAEYAPYWKKISDDHLHANSAYGYIIHREWGFDQLEQCRDMLISDPDTRRAVLNINRAHSRKATTKDEHCTLSVQFLCRPPLLYVIVNMRSQDLWTGFAYDVAYFTSLAQWMARGLTNVMEIELHLHVGSMHIYDKDVEVLSAPAQQDKAYSINLEKLLDRKHKLLHIGKTGILQYAKDKSILIERKL